MITAMPAFMSAVPGPLSTPGSSHLSVWNGWSAANTVSICPVSNSCTGASGRTRRWRWSPRWMMLTLPVASTLSTGSAATSRTSPGKEAKASASSPATRFSPARLPVPLLIAAHFSTCDSIGASAARSIASFSVAVRLVIARL